MINVSKPFLPPQEEYLKLLNEVWKRNWLTNNGPLVNELELSLKEYLKINHLLFVTNGTIALQLAIKALGLKDEVITTPFSYVATTSSLVWENCNPVFVDIDSKTLNIDPSKIENAITEKTTGIVATHVYGNPCDIDAIQKIADKHRLKVIYDAAHSFGTVYRNKSIFDYGDISIASFHATKLFHTVEGGAVVTNNPDILRSLSLLRNFGHTSPVDFDGVGVNGKNSEFHAAMGLCNLKYVDDILEDRKRISARYSFWLEKWNVKMPSITANTVYNHAYYPVIFESEEICGKVFESLKLNNVYPRRYFYPSLTKLNYVSKQEAPVAEDIAKRILCLPLYYGLTEAEVDMICRILIRTLKY